MPSPVESYNTANAIAEACAIPLKQLFEESGMSRTTMWRWKHNLYTNTTKHGLKAIMFTAMQNYGYVPVVVLTTNTATNSVSAVVAIG